MQRETILFCREVFLELQDLKIKTGQPKMDDLDKQLYAEALNPLKTPEQVAKVRAEIRRSCEFCPTAKRVTEIVAGVTGKSTEIVAPYVEKSRRIVSAASADQKERQLQQITGISAETAAENRVKARSIMAKLLQEKPVKKPLRFGEVPEFLKPELADLAEKRREIERRFPALASEGK